MPYDYSNMTNQQLAAKIRQLRRSKLELVCEFGHSACGCSNSRNMNGNAACSQHIQAEIDARGIIKNLNITPERIMHGIRRFHQNPFKA